MHHPPMMQMSACCKYVVIVFCFVISAVLQLSVVCLCVCSYCRKCYVPPRRKLMTTHWTRFVLTSQHSISISLTTGYHMLNCLLVTPAPTSFTSTTIQIIGWNATITPSKASCDHHRCLLEPSFSDYSNSSVFVQSPCCTVNGVRKSKPRQQMLCCASTNDICRSLPGSAWQSSIENPHQSTAV